MIEVGQTWQHRNRPREVTIERIQGAVTSADPLLHVRATTPGGRRTRILSSTLRRDYRKVSGE